MAETYKGLTIRIGGDTTKLQSALQSANGAIRGTQTQLTKMMKALKADPGNMTAVNRQLELMGQKAVEVSSRVNKLRDAVRDVSKQKVKLNVGESEKTIEELANETQNASQRAADALKNYNDINGSLENLYRSINKVARKSEEFGKSFDIRNVDDIDEVAGKLIEIGAASEETVAKVKELRSVWGAAFDENEIAKAVYQFEDLNSELIKSEAEAKQTAASFSKLSLEASKMKIRPDVNQQLERLEQSSEEAAQALSRAQDALNLDPHNAEAIAEVMRRIQDSTTLAQSKLDLLESKLSSMKGTEIERIAESTRNAGDEARIAAQRYEEITQSVTDLKGHISDLQSVMKRMETYGKDDSDEYREMAAEVQRATNEVKQLEAAQREARNAADTAQQVAEYRELEGQIVQTRAEVEKYNAAVKGMTGFPKFLSSNALMELGMTFSTSVTPAITAMGYAAVQSAQDIDSAYRDMRKTVSGTEEDFEALRQAAIDFSTTHVTSADQILSIQAIGGELGVATEDLQTFAETVSNLEVATNLDAEEAATALGQLDNIMNDLNGSTMPAFSDALVRLGNNGASTESQIVDIAKRIGSMGSILGMSTPEVLAWASSIASTGQNAEAAGTAISNTMSDIETAVAKGEDSLEAFAKVAGMSAQEFASAWESDPSSTMKAFIEGLVQVEKDGGSATKTLSDLGITATRQVQAIEGLMQTIGGLDDNLQMSNDAWNGVTDQWGEAGDAANEASKKAEGFSGSIQRMMNMAQVLGAELGESIAPWIDGIADGLGYLMDIFEDSSDEFKRFVVGLGGVAAAAGPLMLMLRSIGSAGKDVISFFKNLKSASVATKALDTAVSGLRGGLVGLGVAVAAVGIGALVNSMAEAAEEAEKTEKATTGLLESCDMAVASMAKSADEVDNFSERLRESGEASDDTTERLAQLADKFNELNTETAGTLTRLEDAKNAIMRLEGRSDLTAQQVGELKSAIEYLNQECGTNYEVVRDSGGAYQVMSDGADVAKESIYKLIDAMKLQAQISGQQQKLEDLYADRATQADEYTTALENQREAQERVNKAQKEFDDAQANADSWSDRVGLYEYRKNLADANEDLKNANSTLAETKRNLDNTDAAIDSVNASIGYAEEAANGAAEGFDAISKSSMGVASVFGDDADLMADFSDALEESGYSLEYFSNLNDTELQRIASEWKENGGSIVDILDDLGISAEQASSDVMNALMNMSNGGVANALTQAGVDIAAFSEEMVKAGITADDLEGIGSAAFARLAANCGGNIDQLIWMINNYNAQPIYNKDGTINVNDVPLTDALGNTYIWNGQELKTLNGNIVIQKQEFETAQGEIYTWNEKGQLVDKTCAVVIEGTTILDSVLGEMEVFNGYVLNKQTGEVYVGFDSLTDCNGAMVEYNDTTLKPIEGEVNVDYQDVVDARAEINKIAGKTFTSTVRINTIKTEKTIKSSYSTSQPARNQFPKEDRSIASVPMSLVQASSATTDAASAISAQATALSRMSRAVPTDLASRASAVVRGSDMVGIRTISSGINRAAEALNRGLSRDRSGANATNYNVTVDGVGTTGRVQGIVMDLLEELIKLGKV